MTEGDHAAGQQSFPTRNDADQAGDPPAPPSFSPGAIDHTPGQTGAYLVLMPEDAVETGVHTLERVSGLSVFSSSDSRPAHEPMAPAAAGAMVFEEIGVAVVDASPGQLGEIDTMSFAESGIIAIEPERVVYTLKDRLWMNYLHGYRDAINHLVDGLSEDTVAGALMAAATWDESATTWGLQATRADSSRFDGTGIKIAILDTGMDLTHPDFSGRTIVAESFVTGEDVQDGHGHGTHCVGIACGPRQPGQLPRYGVATDAAIHVGKVLSNRGSGLDRSILAGINWAIRTGCTIISMSLGASTTPGQAHSRIFETAARRARKRGTIIVAAAGNDSYRPDMVQPVSHPANCPSILSVGALDQSLTVASFSNGGINPDGGEVDIAAPGVAVWSSWPQSLRYRSLNGTSMATPHVAGIAALIAQADPSARGDALVSRLLDSARQLEGRVDEVGRGLVQAP